MAPKHLHTPCNDCAFRRDITPGHLGGSSPLKYIGQAQGPFVVPCHKACDFTDPQWRQKAIDTPQCAGMAIFRANLGVAQKMPQALHKLPQDKTKVFATNEEFLSHHADLSPREAQQALRLMPPEFLLVMELGSPRRIDYATPKEEDHE